MHCIGKQEQDQGQVFVELQMEYIWDMSVNLICYFFDVGFTNTN